MSETFRPVNASLNTSDSYSDITLLREGVNARLYRASKAGKYFAIKTTKDNSAFQLAMLKREYELSISLNHYHLPHFFTFESHTPVGPGIVMEYIDGRNLIEFLAENPPLDTRRRVMAQLLEVVAYIHKNGIIHNDLKPENILISKANDDVKLLDFGLSNTDAHYLTKTMGCTRAYASPELLAQSDDIDARSDIYSIGKIMQLIFPKNYRTFSRKCLHNDRNKRWDNVDQLHHSWNAQQRRIYQMAGVAAIIATSAILIVLWNKSEVAETRQDVLLDSLTVARHETLVAKQQLDSLNAIQNKAIEERQQWEATRDSIVNEAKQLIDDRYRLTLDSIERIPFKEFAYLAITNCTKDINTIINKYKMSAPDETIRSIISSTCETIAFEKFNVLDKKAKTKPCITDKTDEIGFDAASFYYSLLREGKPYRKYNP